MSEEWQPDDRPCPLCNSARRRAIGRRGGDAHRARRGMATTVVRCRDCGGYYTSPTLLPAGNPYAASTPDDYFAAHDEAEKRRVGKGLAEKAAAMLGRTGSMLELGCGRGELLEGARDVGWSVCGVDMTPDFAAEAEARGIEVERSNVETATLLERRFDVILLAMILEHLYRPLDVLRRARRALPAGGLIFVDVPNEASFTLAIGNLYLRARGRDWAMNLSPTFPPYHVVGFTPKSLRRVLDATGFEVVELQRQRWRTDLLLQPHGVIERIEQRGLAAASWIGSKIGRADGLNCWARAV